MGFNISYENSFSAIKRDIYKETVEKNNAKKVKGINQVIEVIEERPPGSAKNTVRNNIPSATAALLNKINLNAYNRSKDN